MELQAVTSQVYIVEGKIQEVDEVPGLLAQSPPARPARGRGRDSLFIHLSLSGRVEDTSTLSQDLLELIANRFYRNSGSVTAALRGAILEANQHLLRLNMRSKSRAREGAIACAVLRQQELFLVQAGEAFALIGRNFGVERLPATAPGQQIPLGRVAGLDLRFYHNWLESGDMLLLPDPRLAYLPVEQVKPILVDSTVEDSVPRLLDLIGEETARLLLVEFAEDLPLSLPQEGITRPVTAPSAPASGRTLPPPTRQPRRQQAAGQSRPTPVPAGEIAESPAAPQGRSLPDFALPAVPLPSAGEMEHTARRAGSQTAYGLARATGWLATLMQRLRPGREATGADEEETGHWALPVTVAIIIPVVVALIVGSVYIQRGRVTRMSEIRREMQQALSEAGQTGDETVQRTAYNEILQLAAEAEALRPGDEDVNRLRQEALTRLDRIDDVTRLTTRRLYTYDESANLTGIVLREGLNGDIYTLDGANNQAYVHETEEDYETFTGEEPETIVAGDQAVGTHVVGTLLDMAWRPRGTQVSIDGVAILDGRGALITYQPSFAAVRAVPLGLASDWVRPVALTQFNERLYVLDPGAGQIWRYFAETDGFFVDDGQRALSLPDLQDAVDVAIYSEDGSVVVLYADGRIRRYGQDSLLWDESRLYESGLESPLIAPTRLKIIGRGLNSSIFIADPGSGRIVQLSLGGNFLAQFKATDEETGTELFSNLGDFEVADDPIRIFSVGGNGLYVSGQ
mgnify:CR=1 FL=1